MAYEQGFYIKMKGFVDSLRAGKTTLEKFHDSVELSYARKQKEKPQILEICEDPDYLENVESACNTALQGLDHMEQGFAFFFDFCEDQAQEMLDQGLAEFKKCVRCFNDARDLALDTVEDARIDWHL